MCANKIWKVHHFGGKYTILVNGVRKQEIWGLIYICLVFVAFFVCFLFFVWLAGSCFFLSFFLVFFFVSKVSNFLKPSDILRLIPPSTGNQKTQAICHS